MITLESVLLHGDYVLCRKDITFKQFIYMLSNASYEDKDFLVEDGYDSIGYDKAEDIDLDNIFILSVEVTLTYKGHNIYLSVSPDVDLIQMHSSAPYKVVEKFVEDLNTKEVTIVE